MVQNSIERRILGVWKGGSLSWKQNNY